MHKVIAETVAPAFDLPWLVAKDEGLFDKEGVEVVLLPPKSKRDQAALRAGIGATNWNKVSSVAGHGSSFEKREANLYFACECGNYRRVQDHAVPGRAVGRRAIIPHAALVVAPGSPIYTPQQLANKPVSAPFHAGSHYVVLQMLEGFLRREEIKLVNANPSRAERFRELLAGDLDCIVLAEPWTTAAEKAGCRVLIESFYHGSEVAGEEIDAETYAAVNRAITTAVHRINSDKRRYMHYFIDHDRQHPEIAALRPEDLPLNRLQVAEPAMIPEEEFQRTYEWMTSWNLIEPGHRMEDLVDLGVEAQSHAVAVPIR